jgi:hypothetical protein
VQRRSARADVTEHEPEHRQSGEVDSVAVGAVGDVIAEHRGNLRCVCDTAHPGERGDVVERGASFDIDADMTSEADGDAPRTQDVPHRLAQTKVHRERERGDELGEPNAGVVPVGVHGASIRVARAASLLAFRS